MPNEETPALMTSRVPVPDPTLLTTQALLREIEGLKELMETKIDNIDTRLDERMAGLKAITTEKFLRVEQQFELVERQRVEQKKDTKDAVDAALTAQKEAVKEQTTASERAIAKSETGTNKQLEQLSENFRIENTGLRATIDDLKDRVRGIEGIKTGGSQTVAQIVAIIGAIAFIVSAGVAVIIATR